MRPKGAMASVVMSPARPRSSMSAWRTIGSTRRAGRGVSGIVQARFARMSGAIAAASARASLSVSRDRRGSAGRSGKSRRQCAPMLASRRSAETTIASASQSRIGRRPGRTRERGQRPDRGAQGAAVAHDPGGMRQDRTDGGRVGSGRDGKAAKRRRRARRRALNRPGDDRAEHGGLGQRVARQPVRAVQSG